jgi:hypothetical protein
MHRNPHGTIPTNPAHISRIMRLWVNALPAVLDVDGSSFPREGIVPYALRHSTPSATPTTALPWRCCES